MLPDAGTWTYPVDWTWRQDGDAWTLDWSPAVIHPKLGERQTLAARSTEADPGALVDRNDIQIVSPIRVYSVVLLTGRTPDLARRPPPRWRRSSTDVDPRHHRRRHRRRRAGRHRGGDRRRHRGPDGRRRHDRRGTDHGCRGHHGCRVERASAADADAPAGDRATNGVGYTVINLRETDFQPLRARLEAIPGLVFPSEERNLPPTRDFARALLAQVNPVVAPLLEGTPGWKVITVDTTGGALETLSETPAGRPGSG